MRERERKAGHRKTLFAREVKNRSRSSATLASPQSGHVVVLTERGEETVGLWRVSDKV